MVRLFTTSLLLGCVALTLASCGSFERSEYAAQARNQMRGMSKEQILACMGPPKQVNHVGATEVWAYRSVGAYDGNSVKDRVGTLTLGSGHGERTECTVNVVMVNDTVATVHYFGPRNDFLSPDAQCGYLVEHCALND